MKRILLVTCLLGAAGISLALLRHELACCSHRVQQLHRRRTELSKQIWSREVELARQQIPERIRERIAALGVALAPPRIDRVAASSESRRHAVARTQD